MPGIEKLSLQVLYPRLPPWRARKRDSPADYLKIVSALLPKDVNLNVRPLDNLSDEQLLARLAQLTEMAKPLLAKRDGAISTAGLTRQ
jgi:hypothetical protein